VPNLPGRHFPPHAEPSDPPVEIPAGAELTVFRIVKLDDPHLGAYHESFKSHAELDLPPRGVELEHLQIYEGISVYDTVEAATEVARRWSKIGEFVARMQLRGGELDVLVLRWGPEGHLTLWGEALMLSSATAEIVPVQAR
jgi:hypothetical protein